MHKGTLPIGMFSRASSISIKALRAYHEAGILVPARVDPETGYRIYAVDQLADAAIVARLRALDVPLAQVKEILHGRDPDLTRRILETHQTHMQQRLAETQRIIEELQSGVAPVTHTPVHVREEPARDTVRLLGAVTPETFEAWLTQAFARLGASLDALGVRAGGSSRNTVGTGDSARRTRTRGSVHPDRRTHRHRRTRSGIALGEVPATSVAVLVHAGEYTRCPIRIDAGRMGREKLAVCRRWIREWCMVGQGRWNPPLTAPKSRGRSCRLKSAEQMEVGFEDILRFWFPPALDTADIATWRAASSGGFAAVRIPRCGPIRRGVEPCGAR